jgi:hypothetical protein
VPGNVGANGTSARTLWLAAKAKIASDPTNGNFISFIAVSSFGPSTNLSPMLSTHSSDASAIGS